MASGARSSSCVFQKWLPQKEESYNLTGVFGTIFATSNFMARPSKSANRQAALGVTTRVLRLRIKDKHARVLSAMAREVNQVWNYCNETSHRAIRERSQWLSGYDLQKLTNGFSKCEGVQIGSPTVQQVCEDYAKARKQFKRAKLRWRVSNPKSSKYSLGWIPFKARALQYKAGQIAFAGQRLHLWDSYGLGDYELRAGSSAKTAGDAGI